MAKFKKVSADEARAKRKDSVKEIGGSAVIVKGATFKAPASWDSEKRSARFIMTTESTDRYGDIVSQTGLDITRFLDNPTALLFHNSRSWPCGKWSDVVKNLSGRPKRTEGTLNFLPEGTEPDADRAARHVAAGSIKTISIGFQPNWDEIEFILDDDESWTGGFRYNSSELLEASLVPLPANPDCLARDAGGDWTLAKQVVEEVLDTWVRSPEGLLLPRAEYEAAYRTVIEKIAADTVEPQADVESAPESEINSGTKSVDEVRAELGKDPLPNAAEVKDVETTELTDDIIAAFAAQGSKDCTLLFKHTDGATSLVFARETDLDHAKDGGEVAELAMLNTLTISEMHEIKAKVEAKLAAVEPETKTESAGTLTIELDTTEIDKATEKVTALELLIETVSGKLAKFFGKKDAEPETLPPAPPSAEQVEAAKAKAAAVRERLATKGLIQA